MILVQKLEFWFDKNRAMVCRNVSTILDNVQLYYVLTGKSRHDFNKIWNTI